MLPYLSVEYGNPSGAHRRARAARKAIDDAREVVAMALGAAPSDIVFTSGGTESDNLAVLGVHDRLGGTLVCSAIEHHAVLEPVLSRSGQIVPVHPSGVVDLGALESILDAGSVTGSAQHGVSAVSVMLVNNETGLVQPVDEVASIVHRLAPGALVHTDAVQAAPSLDVSAQAADADLVSISAHKFGGPKGVGALVVRPAAATALAARAVGGGQERERRGGTHNVAGIVAMAEALRITVERRDAANRQVGKLRDRLEAGLVAAVAGTILTCAGGRGTPAMCGTDRAGPRRSAGHCHVCFEGVESEALLYLLEEHGVYASAGSSCASGAMEPSHVLTAMGVPRSLAFGSVRFSLGYSSTESDVVRALEVVAPAVEQLRAAASP